ncbi:serine/threonine-protein kinase [Mycobacterium sp. Marseille-P9652]|uniref:serine/threonine-protein kinase n=1 Tax=Mycobacterium sp. Marseille-P9652 TaxID=2654950 RepID=UPI0018D0030C|nr:serine/threonine-protein kinase [Mycobacterium sp. Marseille-P9652]
MSLDAGEVFAGYTILRRLGAGGMGEVYLASHPRLPREDALKVLPENLTADAEFRARFLREAELAAGLTHPHIVGIHDRGECDGRLWISMDYVAGADAGRLLSDHPRGMPVDEVAAIVTAVAEALDYAHHRGLLHRDVKPANILLGRPDDLERRIFLSDFGFARHIDDATALTATNMTVGTVAYVAPEQLRGDPVDGRADQYGLACTAFTLLTGTPPYDDPNPAVVISQHVSAPVPSIGARRPELAGLDPVFAAAMAKEPADRFTSCGEFADHLARILGPGSDVADTDTTAALAATRPGRRRVLVGALAGVGLLVVAGGVFAGITLSGHPHPETTAKHTTAPGPSGVAPAPNTGPLTGIYRIDFGPGTTLDDVPGKGVPPVTDTYAIRSVCRPTGCVATASRLSGELKLAPNPVFDQVDGRWVAVTIGSDKCRDAPAEVWQVLTLQPRPDGGLAGEYRGASANACNEKRMVTVTRTGDVDVNTLPDPAGLPPRAGSPAEALHGRYHLTRKFEQGIPPQQGDQAVTTDCLRTGERCMSYFHSKVIDTPLIFAAGGWTLHVEHDDNDPGCGGLVYAKATGNYALPQPPQDPITSLTGHDHLDESSGKPTCMWSVNFVETYTRMGD